MSEAPRQPLAERAARAGMIANYIELIQAQQGRTIWTDADGAVLLMMIDIGEAHAAGQHIDDTTRTAAPGADAESRKSDNPLVSTMQKALEAAKAPALALA